MKRITILSMLFFVAENIFAQEFPLLKAKLEGTNFDKRGVMASSVFASTTIVSELRMNMDGKNTLSFSFGPVISKRKDGKIRLALIPGIVYSMKMKDEKIFYSGAIFFRAEEIRGKEFYLYIKGMTRNHHSRFVVESDFLFSLSKSFKLGPSVFAETERYVLDSPVLGKAIQYNDIFNLGIKTIFQPLGWEKFSFTSIVSWENKMQDTRKDLFPVKVTIENRIAFGFGLQYSF